LDLFLWTITGTWAPVRRSLWQARPWRVLAQNNRTPCRGRAAPGQRVGLRGGSWNAPSSRSRHGGAEVYREIAEPHNLPDQTRLPHFMDHRAVASRISLKRHLVHSDNPHEKITTYAIASAKTQYSGRRQFARKTA